MPINDALIEQAMKLSPKERQELIHKLAVSLEGQPVDDAAAVESGWAEVVERRAREVLAGKAKTVDARKTVRAAATEMRSRPAPD